MEFTTKFYVFTLKFLRWVYLSNHASESIHSWVMGTLECLLTFHKFWIHAPGGAGGQNLGHLLTLSLPSPSRNQYLSAKHVLLIDYLFILLFTYRLIFKDFQMLYIIRKGFYP